MGGSTRRPFSEVDVFQQPRAITMINRTKQAGSETIIEPSAPFNTSGTHHCLLLPPVSVSHGIRNNLTMLQILLTTMKQVEDRADIASNRQIVHQQAMLNNINAK